MTFSTNLPLSVAVLEVARSGDLHGRAWRRYPIGETPAQKTVRSATPNRFPIKPATFSSKENIPYLRHNDANEPRNATSTSFESGVDAFEQVSRRGSFENRLLIK